MGRPTKNDKVGVIVNNAKYGFGKEYVVLDKYTGRIFLLEQTYATIEDAKKDAKLSGIKISKVW